MKWGVWNEETKGEFGGTHVAPCDEDGNLDDANHMLHPSCPCHPTAMERKDGSVLWVHELIQ